MRKILVVIFALSVVITSCNKDNEGESTPNNNRSVGNSAAELLKAEPFSKLILEIRYINGFQPPQSSVDQLTQFIATYCNKPNGIEVVSLEVPESARTAYSLEDIRNIEDKHRTRFNTENTIALYVFFASGDYIQNNDTVSTLGIAYKNTSIVIFGKTIDDNTGGIGRPTEATVTSAIFEHELGHLLGLTNIGSPMQTPHEDEDSEGHCDNEDCLMYFSLNSVVSMSNLMNGIPSLDANCRADLKANGGK